jgi:hypothetical protein
MSLRGVSDEAIACYTGLLCKFFTILFALYSMRLLRCAARTIRLASRNDSLEVTDPTHLFWSVLQGQAIWLAGRF